MKQFEYHIYTMEPEMFSGGRVDLFEMDKAINELGSQGWELVCSLDTNRANGRTSSVSLIFKRERNC